MCEPFLYTQSAHQKAVSKVASFDGHLRCWYPLQSTAHRNACYHAVQNILSSSLLSKNLKIKVHRTIILLTVLYGCETWSLTLREERRLKVFENRLLRRIFGPKKDEVTGEWRKLYISNQMVCTAHQIFFWR